MKSNKNKVKNLAITGAAGRIGKILREGLGGKYSLILLDKKKLELLNAIQIDITKDYRRLIKIFKNCDKVIHLAWDTREDFPNEVIVPENKLMIENIYRAGVAAGVKKIIIASSVHANAYSNHTKPNFISPYDPPWPDTPYGATKIYAENLGKYFSKKYCLEVICLRFGGINPEDRIIYEEDPNYDKVWLSKKDCVALVEACLKAEMILGNFAIVHGVSNNIARVHDNANPFNWQPKDGQF